MMPVNIGAKFRYFQGIGREFDFWFLEIDISKNIAIFADQH